MEELQEGTPRQRERHAVQQLLTAMMDGDLSFTVGHEPSGKPFLQYSLSTPDSGVSPVSKNLENSSPVPKNLKISISHTRGYAAILLSEEFDVGIDIEYRSDRVERIASRFIRPDEKTETTEEKLLLWSAKEAVYKLFSEDRLQFFDMRTLSMNDGELTMWVEKRKEAVSVCYEFTDDYVLTYVVLHAN